VTEVKRKKGESFESLLRRFSTRIQKSGRLIQAKKVRFNKPKQSKTEKKSVALKRETIKSKINYMLRSGKITEDDLRGKKSVIKK
jgi:ribosomal protein S21